MRSLWARVGLADNHSRIHLWQWVDPKNDFRTVPQIPGILAVEMLITKLHFFPFHIEPFIPWSEQTIQSATFAVDIKQVAPRTMNLVLGALTYRLCKGRFQNSVIYLRAELDQGAKVLLGDGSGCVKFGGAEYFLFPRSYLWVNDTLRRVMTEQNPDFPNPQRK